MLNPFAEQRFGRPCCHSRGCCAGTWCNQMLLPLSVRLLTVAPFSMWCVPPASLREYSVERVRQAELLCPVCGAGSTGELPVHPVALCRIRWHRAVGDDGGDIWCTGRDRQQPPLSAIYYQSARPRTVCTRVVGDRGLRVRGIVRAARVAGVRRSCGARMRRRRCDWQPPSRVCEIASPERIVRLREDRLTVHGGARLE